MARDKTSIPAKPTGKPTGMFSSKGSQKMDKNPSFGKGVQAAKAEAYKNINNKK